jgi:hypothetical protein
MRADAGGCGLRRPASGSEPASAAAAASLAPVRDSEVVGSTSGGGKLMIMVVSANDLVNMDVLCTSRCTVARPSCEFGPVQCVAVG